LKVFEAIKGFSKTKYFAAHFFNNANYFLYDMKNFKSISKELKKIEFII